MRLTDALRNNIRCPMFQVRWRMEFRSRPSKGENSRERPTRLDWLATKCHLVAFLAELPASAIALSTAPAVR